MSWTYRDGMWLRDRASVIPEGRTWIGTVYGDRYPEDGREVGRYVTAQGAMRACDTILCPATVDAQWVCDVVALKVRVAGIEAAENEAARRRAG